MELILASQSARRRELLNLFGIPHTAISTDTDESIEDYYTPPEVVMELSRRKAESAVNVTGNHNGKLIIAADTIVSYEKAILGKPSDLTDAKRMLAMLSGSWHDVYTGVTLTDGEKYITEAELTRVKFRHIDSREINHYIESGNPLDKAGAYGIQEGAGLFVERIEGDYYNVMGLPMCKLSVMLKNFDIYLY